MNKQLLVGIAAILTISATIWNSLYNPKSIAIILAISIILALTTLIKKEKTQFTLAEAMICLFGLCSALSLILSPIKTLGWDEITMELGVLTIMLVTLRTTWLKTKLLAIWVGVLITIQTFFSWYQLLFRDESRSAGTFFSFSEKANYFPNALGLFTVTAIPVAYAIKNKWAKHTVIALGTSTLLLSFSRGALIVFIGQILLITIYELFNKNHKQLLGLILSVIIGIGLFSGGQLIRSETGLKQEVTSEKYAFEGTEQITSVNERSQFITETTKQLIQNPVKFYGPNSFSYIYPQFQPMFLANAPHPHNWLLKLSFERGVWTTLTLILILSATLFFTLKYKKYQDLETYLLGVSLLGLILHNMIDYNLNFSINFLLFGLILSLIVKKTWPKSSKKSPTLTFILILTLTIGGTWFYKQANLTVANRHLAVNNLAEAAIYLEKVNLNDSNFILVDIHEKQGSTEKAQITAKKELELNPYNAFVTNKYGSLIKNKNEKLTIYGDAIKLDPQNFWIYYLNYYKTAHELNRYDIFRDNTNQLYRKILKYEKFAKVNLHFTAQTGNIDNAIALSKLFELYDKRYIEITASLQSSKERFSSS